MVGLKLRKFDSKSRIFNNSQKKTGYMDIMNKTEMRRNYNEQ